MNRNVGDTDRTIRFALGMLLAILGGVSLLGQALGRPIGAVLFVVGLVLLYTGVTRQCLLYRPFGIDTNR